MVNKTPKSDELLESGPAGTVELRESELDQVVGGKGTTSINDITFGVQKDKMASANKNTEAVKALL